MKKVKIKPTETKGSNYSRDLTLEIMADPQNTSYTERGVRPLFSIHKNAEIVLIGQAPGLETERVGITWFDKSGERLKEWLGLTEEEFYNEKNLALVPMDFYFPGSGKSGHLPPRKGFADKWHHKAFRLIPNIKLTILIGQYAQKYYLKDPERSNGCTDLYNKSLTENVKNYKKFLEFGFFPIPHPSPRNNIWLRQNPWFEKKIIPVLQKEIRRRIKS